MEYGLKIRGDHGIYQIDGSHVTLSLQSIADLTVPQTTGSASMNAGGIVKYKAGEFDVFIPESFIHFPKEGVIQGESDIRNKRAFNCRVYSFSSTPKVWHPSKYGLSVRNSSGFEIFNSTWLPLKIVRVLKISADVYNRRRVTIDIPSGRKYAVSWAGGCEYIYAGNGNSEWFFADMFMISTSQIIFEPSKSYQFRQASGADDTTLLEGDIYALIVDVTHYE